MIVQTDGAAKCTEAADSCEGVHINVQRGKFIVGSSPQGWTLFTLVIGSQSARFKRVIAIR
jgi:hypothetical protein